MPGPAERALGLRYQLGLRRKRPGHPVRPEAAELGTRLRLSGERGLPTSARGGWPPSELPAVLDTGLLTDGVYMTEWTPNYHVRVTPGCLSPGSGVRGRLLHCFVSRINY